MANGNKMIIYFVLKSDQSRMFVYGFFILFLSTHPPSPLVTNVKRQAIQYEVKIK
jgi:hypothetical protein